MIDTMTQRNGSASALLHGINTIPMTSISLTVFTGFSRGKVYRSADGWKKFAKNSYIRAFHHIVTPKTYVQFSLLVLKLSIITYIFGNPGVHLLKIHCFSTFALVSSVILSSRLPYSDLSAVEVST